MSCIRNGFKTISFIPYASFQKKKKWKQTCKCFVCHKKNQKTTLKCVLWTFLLDLAPETRKKWLNKKKKYQKSICLMPLMYDMHTHLKLRFMFIKKCNLQWYFEQGDSVILTLTCRQRGLLLYFSLLLSHHNVTRYVEICPSLFIR